MTCDFPGVRALDRVSLQFFPGEAHALAGENGAGKSTVLRILSGLARPTEGRVRVGTRTYTQLDDAHELGIRVVPQEPVLVPHLSVAENILLGHLPRNRFGVVDWRESDAARARVIEQRGSRNVESRGGSVSPFDQPDANGAGGASAVGWRQYIPVR